MPPKRKAPRTKTGGGGPAKKMKKSQMVTLARKIVATQLNRHIETKQSTNSDVDMIDLLHNTIKVLDLNLLRTTQGVTDPMNTDSLNRIGDEINIKGVSIKMMLELHPNYSDVTFRFMVIKCAKGDVLTTATLFKGQSVNKMLDTVNTERYSILFQKYYKITARNPGTTNASTLNNGNGFFELAGPVGAPANLNTIGMGIHPTAGAFGASQTVSAATKIVKIYIPGKRFVKNGVLRYENGTDQAKFFDYRSVIYAYANGRTSRPLNLQGQPQEFTPFIVGHMNDKITTMFFKDA